MLYSWHWIVSPERRNLQIYLRFAGEKRLWLQNALSVLKSKLHRMLVSTAPLHTVPSLPPSANPALLQFQLKRLNWRKLRYGGVRCDHCAGGVALVEKQCHALGWGTLKSLSVSFSIRFPDLNWNGVGKGSQWGNSCAFRVDVCCFAFMSK